ncbi:MAG: hypothetical protein WCD76_18045 [Pyrinomonadaceae bacterium]
MPQDDQPAKKNKGHVIAFRVDEDSYSELENCAALAGKTVNDWCRDELLARIAEGTPLTANEELIHQEVIIFGSLMAHYFDMIATKKLTPEVNEQLKEFLTRERKDIYQGYFAKRKDGK